MDQTVWHQAKNLQLVFGKTVKEIRLGRAKLHPIKMRCLFSEVDV
jgi:hypothetical protein